MKEIKEVKEKPVEKVHDGYLKIDISSLIFLLLGIALGTYLFREELADGTKSALLS